MPLISCLSKEWKRSLMLVTNGELFAGFHSNGNEKYTKIEEGSLSGTKSWQMSENFSNRSKIKDI
jgi:hypothetical protein